MVGPAQRLARRERGALVARLGRLAGGTPVSGLRDRPDRGGDRPSGDLDQRRRPEPDVGGALFRVPPPVSASLQRRAGHDGLLRPGGDGRRARRAGARGLGGRRRRRLPDDDAGAGDAGPGPDPGEDRGAQQPSARDDPPVAGDHLRRELPLRRAARAGPRAPVRGLRHPGLARDAARRGRDGHRRGAEGARSGADRLPPRRGAERLPDDAARQGPVRDGRGGARVSGASATARAATDAEVEPGPPRHVVTALVVDRPGTLNRVSGLLRARSFNIESLTVGSTHEPGHSRMTIAVRGDDAHLRQVLAQLERLIDVLEVTDLTGSPRLEYELALVEVDPPRTADDRRTIERVLAAAGGETPTSDSDAWRLRLTATPDRIDDALDLLRGHGLRSLVRAGAVAMAAT